MGDAVGRPIELFRGSFNVLFDEPQEVDRLTKGSLCRYRPVLECAPLPTDEPIWRRKKRRDGKPYLFYRVGLQHGSEWRTAFLWLPSYELKSTGRQGATHNGRYDFVLERIEDAKPGDRVRVDFSPTYAAPQRSGQ